MSIEEVSNIIEELKKERQSELQKKWRAKNPDKVKEYRQKHAKQYNRNKYAENKEYYNDYGKNYYKKNKEKFKAYREKYKKIREEEKI